MTPKYLLLLGAFNSKVSKLLGALIKMNEKWKETKEMEQIGSSSDSRSRDVTWFTTSRSPGVSPTFQFYAFFLFSSVAQSCPAVCDPMDCSMPGFPVLHCLPEFKFMSMSQWCYQEYWTELPFPSSEDLPDSGIELASPVSTALQACFTHWTIGEAPCHKNTSK